ncbi:MAG: DUF2256 domain-containing protein [Planctomycetes bacterium]|nr:DUF2256 domain-containing protein [Planctomycetota bacterium]MCH9724269.1 DUF2256 domain-containing protein [Planctomycetota bacterium]MCH9776685.1 DUF2256 domain-containing protein [Planctomycetota bacterium]MCH9790077.1 DUF2256 domain-containing protein [Planctomycetota bacterium]
MTMSPPNMSEKICEVCGKPFCWRNKCENF